MYSKCILQRNYLHITSLTTNLAVPKHWAFGHVRKHIRKKLNVKTHFKIDTLITESLTCPKQARKVNT